MTFSWSLNSLQPYARIQCERLFWSGEFEHLFEFIGPQDGVCFSRAPSGRNVLDGFTRENKLIRLDVEVGDVLVDQPLDVELSQECAAARCVEAEDAEIFVGLTLRVPLLGLVDAPVLDSNEPRIQNARVLALHPSCARLALGGPLPPTDQDAERLQRVGRSRLGGLSRRPGQVWCERVRLSGRRDLEPSVQRRGGPSCVCQPITIKSSCRDAGLPPLGGVLE